MLALLMSLGTRRVARRASTISRIMTSQVVSKLFVMTKRTDVKTGSAASDTTGAGTFKPSAADTANRATIPSRMSMLRTVKSLLSTMPNPPYRLLALAARRDRRRPVAESVNSSCCDAYCADGARQDADDRANDNKQWGRAKAAVQYYTEPQGD